MFIMKSGLTQLLKNVGRRRFHTTQSINLFYESPDKDGFYQKSEEEKNWEKLPLKEKLKIEIELYKEGIKDWVGLMKHNFLTGPRIFNYEHEINLIWRFTGKQEDLDRWVISTDKDSNVGYSTADLTITPNSKGLFHGFLDTKLPVDGRIKNTGFCNAKLLPELSPFKNITHYDWETFTHIVFRVRGDGRTYSVNLHLHRKMDVCQYDTYHYFIWTRGGPYWQHVRIPFSKFLMAYKGRVQASMNPLPLDEVAAVSFTLADKITGPFRFEIDYIGVEYDPSHIEEFAYESYDYNQAFW